MAELLLVANPKRRKRRRKMSALQRKYFGKKRSRRTHSRKRRHHVAAAAPRRRRRRARPSGARPYMGYVVGRKRVRRLKMNPHRRLRYRRRHNPSFRGFTGAIMPTVKAGATGAIGALGLDALWGFASSNATLSPYLSNQYVGFAAKAAGAVLVGTLGGKVLRGKGTALAVGAMTVTAHDFLKALLQSTLPGVFGPGGSVPLGSYLSGVGSYLSGSAPIVGTATVPQAYLPFSGAGGSSANPSGVYVEDTMGMDPWGGSDQDGRVGYSGY
jgi:hypothetical protein